VQGTGARVTGWLDAQAHRLHHWGLFPGWLLDLICDAYDRRLDREDAR
jgi:hypothetical protein